MKKALAFLRGADPLDYGRRFARLRWRRAVRAEEVREVFPDEPAREAFAGAEAWLLVRDETALPWPGSLVPLPSPGGVVVAAASSAAEPAAHTLRELEARASARNDPGISDAGPAAHGLAISFRPGDFAIASEETVAGLVDRLLGPSTPRRIEPDFRVLSFEDPSERERPELTRHIPEGARRMLDAGCGAGGSSGALRRRREALHVTGIEKNPASARLARPRLDRVVAGDANRALADLASAGESFDVFLFADVLEHLADPVEALARARRLAVAGATLVASVPNAGHLSIVRDLVMGRFDPVPAGLADSGHLRWFTKASLSEALEEAGWHPVSIESWPGAAPPEAAEFLSELKGWAGLDRTSLMTYQWIAVARPDPNGPRRAG